MSTKTLYQFFNKVAESEELQYRLDEGGEIDAEALIALGAECGCEFTAEELQDMAELSDEELDTVAGGALRETLMARSRIKRIAFSEPELRKWKAASSFLKIE